MKLLPLFLIFLAGCGQKPVAKPSPQHIYQNGERVGGYLCAGCTEAEAVSGAKEAAKPFWAQPLVEPSTPNYGYRCWMNADQFKCRDSAGNKYHLCPDGGNQK